MNSNWVIKSMEVINLHICKKKIKIIYKSLSIQISLIPFIKIIQSRLHIKMNRKVKISKWISAIIQTLKCTVNKSKNSLKMKKESKKAISLIKIIQSPLHIKMNRKVKISKWLSAIIQILKCTVNKSKNSLKMKKESKKYSLL